MPISDDPARFRPGARIIHEDGRELVVARSRNHGARVLVAFEGVGSRTEAESLRGAVYASPEDLRELEPGEFWEGDLIGLEVIDAAGARIGRVADVRSGGAQDLLVLDTEAGERFVPLVEAIVTDVDVASGRVVIDPPPGLLD